MRLRSIGMGYFLGVPDAFSLLNLAFGFLAILMAINNQLSLASVFVLIAIVFDSIDGWVARKTNRADHFGFGKNIDSLADIVSFGVAPGVILYSIGLAMSGWIAYFSAIVALFLVICGILRLTRFNVIAGKINFKGFVGFPIPGMAMILVSYYLSGLFNIYVAMILMLFIGYLMISTIKYPKINNIYGIALSGLMILLLILPINVAISGVNIPALVLFVLSIIYLFITFLEFFMGESIASKSVNIASKSENIANNTFNKAKTVRNKVNSSINENIDKISKFDEKKNDDKFDD